MGAWSIFVDGSRLCALLLFLYCSITINIYTISCLCLLLMTFYCLDKQHVLLLSNKDNKSVDDNVPDNIVNKYTEEILDYVLYDSERCLAVEQFEPVKNNTHCVFAKTAKLWGSRDYDITLSLEENVKRHRFPTIGNLNQHFILVHNISACYFRSVPAVIKFLAISEYLKLDGFVFSLPGDKYGCDPNTFGQAVRTVLSILSAADPSGYDCMSKSFIASAGWSFELNSIPIFVTTFAPCYPSNHSRYAFDANNAFILLQVMHSFVRHNIGEDTPHTNWEQPKTIRDKIRVSYKLNNRAYLIRNTVHYPTAHDIVRGMDSMTTDVLTWWKPD